MTPREHISDTVSALQASKMLSAARGMLVVIHGASSALVRGVFAPIVALCAILSHRLPGPAFGRKWHAWLGECLACAQGLMRWRLTCTSAEIARKKKGERHAERGREAWDLHVFLISFSAFVYGYNNGSCVGGAWLGGLGAARAGPRAGPSRAPGIAHARSRVARVGRGPARRGEGAVGQHRVTDGLAAEQALDPQ